MDYFLDNSNCDNRLLQDYRTHKSIVVAVDFDNTIYDFHKAGILFTRVIKLLKRCNALGFPVVIFTANTDHALVKAHCAGIGIDITGINENVIPGFTGGKIYYNILLDDRAGLPSAYGTLRYVVDIAERKPKMFSLIIFDDTDWKDNKPHKCYQVGTRNCVSITENILGTSGGILVSSYIVKFKDNTEIEISNTIYVS